MLKKDKNGFLKIINKEDLGKADFSAEEREHLFIIRYVESPLYFHAKMNWPEFDSFKYRSTRFLANYSLSGFKPMVGGVAIKIIHEEFREWLRTVVVPYKKELARKDKWKTLLMNREVRTSYSTYDTGAFSSEEKARVKRSVDHFQKAILGKYDTSEAQESTVIDYLEYLRNAVDRLNKFDWQGVAIQTIISIGTTLCLDALGGQGLFTLFASFLGKSISVLEG